MWSLEKDVLTDFGKPSEAALEAAIELTGVLPTPGEIGAGARWLL